MQKVRGFKYHCSANLLPTEWLPLAKSYQHLPLIWRLFAHQCGIDWPAEKQCKVYVRLSKRSPSQTTAHTVRWKQTPRETCSITDIDKQCRMGEAHTWAITQQGVTWDIVDIASVDKQVSVTGVTQRGQRPNNAHAGSDILPQVAFMHPEIIRLTSPKPLPTFARSDFCFCFGT